MSALGNKTEVETLHGEIAEMQKRIAMLEQVIDNFPGGIVLTDADNNILICNRYQRNLQEFPDSLFEGKTVTLEDLFRFNAIHGEYGPCDDIEELVASKMVLVEKREAHHYERTRPNGSVVEVRGVPLQHGGFVSCYMDVTENRAAQAMVKDLALTDPLTGLANRRLLTDRFEQARARAKRGEDFAIHYIDLDFFKPINDKYGHKAGDAVLKEVASRLKSAVRETDTVARIGGDEFVILQADAGSHRTTAQLAHRLISEICETIYFEGFALGVSASIGIAASEGGLHGIDEIMRRADEALYHSKKNGRGRAALFEEKPRLKGAA